MTTEIQFVDRDEVASQTPQTENPVSLREDELGNDRAIAELLDQIVNARRSLRITEKELEILEQSLSNRRTGAVSCHS